MPGKEAGNGCKLEVRRRQLLLMGGGRGGGGTKRPRKWQRQVGRGARINVLIINRQSLGIKQLMTEAWNTNKS